LRDSIQELFGVVFKGPWSPANIASMIEGLWATADRLAGEMPGYSASEVFRSVYRTSSSVPMVMDWDPEGCEACRGEDGVPRGAFVRNGLHIQWATMSSQSLSRRNHTVHELGHAFNARRGGAPYSALSAAIEGNSAFERGNDLTKNYGFAGALNNRTWNQNPDNSVHEIFADMFLGWVFNAWESNSDIGALRANWMNSNISTWLDNTIR
jgi:hypothetical protein